MGKEEITNDDVVVAIKRLANLLEVEDHELLECLDDNLIADADAAPLWEILHSG
jgi:hypothetical protein